MGTVVGGISRTQIFGVAFPLLFFFCTKRFYVPIFLKKFTVLLWKLPSVAPSLPQAAQTRERTSSVPRFVPMFVRLDITLQVGIIH